MLVKQGAIILDVRSPGEYKQGHIKGSLNTPLNDLSQHITKLKKTPLLLLVVHQGCASAKKHFKMVLYKCIMAEAGAATEQIIMNVQHLVSDWHFVRLAPRNIYRNTSLSNAEYSFGTFSRFYYTKS
jgi:rhodanese-related sulfurtransferase